MFRGSITTITPAVASNKDSNRCFVIRSERRIAAKIKTKDGVADVTSAAFAAVDIFVPIN